MLQALQYLRKLCSHPLLVLDAAVPEHVAAVEAQLGPWAAAQAGLRDLSHAPKLQALKQLLSECGIGVEPGAFEGGGFRVYAAPVGTTWLEAQQEACGRTGPRTAVERRGGVLIELKN